MKIEEFYKAVKDVVLFPGSLDELNSLEKLCGSGKAYELLPAFDKKAEKYTKGVFVPSIEDIKSYYDMLNKTHKVVCTQDGLIEMVKYWITERYGILNYINLDIRIKALEIGADGLTHFQKFDEDYFMGVPVKLAK